MRIRLSVKFIQKHMCCPTYLKLAVVPGIKWGWSLDIFFKRQGLMVAQVKKCRVCHAGRETRTDPSG